jgi:hypothetical protein
MARPLVIDGRNLLQGEVMKSFGFEYDSFGRPDLAKEMVRSVA